jgi:hypothetical protein
MQRETGVSAVFDIIDLQGYYVENSKRMAIILEKNIKKVFFSHAKNSNEDDYIK